MVINLKSPNASKNILTISLRSVWARS